MASVYFGHSWRVDEQRGIALKICGKCGGQGGRREWPGFTCFNCGGHPILDTMKLPEYKEMVAKDEARAAKRLKDSKHLAHLILPIVVEWNKLQLKAFKAYTILKQQGQRVDSEIFFCQRGGSFPKGKWTRISTWEKKVAKARKPIEAALAALPAGWEDYVAPPPEPKYVSQFVGEVKKRQEFTVIVHKIMSFNGYLPNQITYLHIMTDEAGNSLVWKGSSRLYSDKGQVQDGDTVVIKATVKEHVVYRNNKGEDVNQTVLTRCVLVKNLEEVA